MFQDALLSPAINIDGKVLEVTEVLISIYMYMVYKRAWDFLQAACFFAPSRFIEQRHEESTK